MADLQWWQRAVIYQIYTLSFQDSTNDGFGDIPGIISRLDYLRWLGIDALWLTPIHPSPWMDWGYDISDYCDVHPRLGKLEDVDTLLQEAHARELRVLLDWVPNHTSSAHPWFQESRASRDNPKHDWYLWADPKPDGGLPTNWISVFGGSVWKWEPAREQYYCHHFHEDQPDLNWRNPTVRMAMLDALHFWLQRGVDGFRVDATSLPIKDDLLRDNPPNPIFDAATMSPDDAVISLYNRDQPSVHNILTEVRAICDDYGDRTLLGELYQPIDRIMHYYGDEQPELHLPLNLELVWCEWTPAAVAEAVERYYRLLPAHGWPNWMLSTHDVPRLNQRVQPDQVRVAVLLEFTLSGALIVYYGAEIGLPAIPEPPDPPRDPQGIYTGQNRDPVRGPMQWDTSPGGGFTSGEPWLPLVGDCNRLSVAAQENDPHSVLSLYRRLIRLRHEEPRLISGTPFDLTHSDALLAYHRSIGEQTWLVVLNFSDQPQTFSLDEQDKQRQILLSTGLDRDGERVAEQLTISANEGLIVGDFLPT